MQDTSTAIASLKKQMGANLCVGSLLGTRLNGPTFGQLLPAEECAEAEGDEQNNEQRADQVGTRNILLIGNQEHKDVSTINSSNFS